MKKDKNPNYVEFQPFRPGRREEYGPIPADVFSEPRIPVRSDRKPNFADLENDPASLVPDVSDVSDVSDTTTVATTEFVPDFTDAQQPIPADVFSAPRIPVRFHGKPKFDDFDTNVKVTELSTSETTVDPITFNQKKTIMTVSGKFEGESIALADYDSTVKKVNASRVETDLSIVGNANDNSLKGGKGDDTLSGGEGDDILTGGKGNDVFVYSAGDDYITDYTAKKDKISLGDNKVKYVELDGKNVVFSFEEGGTLTVKNGKNKNLTFVDSEGNETTEKFTAKNILEANENLADMWFNPNDNFANSDDQQFDSILEDTENYSSISKAKVETPNSFLSDGDFSDFADSKPSMTFARPHVKRD